MVNKETGLIETPELNKIIVKETKRKNGTLRVQRFYDYCPTMAEQHSARETDLNYLIKKYRPDELAAYLAARTAYKQEILGHDFSQEPALDEARTHTYKLKQAYESLPEKIKKQFKNHVEFLKFIDNPLNQEKMVQMGLMTKTEIKKHTDPPKNDDSNDEKKDPKQQKNKNESKQQP